MSRLLRTLLRVTGNRFVQRALENNVEFSQFLMGIGSGGRVSMSGERFILDILRRIYQPPYCVFDVGSNQGQFLKVAMESLASADFRIHCFEPARAAFTLLAAAAANDGRIKLNNLAMGKERGSAVLHYDRPASGLASLTNRRLDHFGIAFTDSETVALDTIDDYCSAHSVERINLLKMDIEGHELDALSGASNMITRRAVDIIAFEFGGCNIDTRSFLQDYWYFFEGARMNLFRVTPSGFLAPVSAYRESYEQFRTTNFVALRND
jgi:FkbM family methyltransferase